MTSTRTHSERGNWGRWGAEDERRTLNLITPESVLEAMHPGQPAADHRRDRQPDQLDRGGVAVVSSTEMR